MTVTLFIQLLIAHLLADFTFQTQKLSEKKSEKIISKHMLLHVLIVGVLSYVFAFQWSFWWAALLLMMLHLGIDVLKNVIQQKKHETNFFFWDQGLHMLSLIGIVYLFECADQIEPYFVFSTKNAMIIAAFIFSSKPSNFIIKNILDIYHIKAPDESDTNADDRSLNNAGKLIGIVERFLALGLILLGQYEAVGLIIAAKSILRFNQTQKSEYVLVGTLLSFGIAIFWGILIQFF
jgi:hypothetical protein